MRITHIETVNQVARTYADALTRRGHTSTIFEPSLAGAHLPAPLKLAMMPARVWHLRTIVGQLNAKHCDLVHIQWASYGILGLAGRVPYIVQCHGSDVRERLKDPLFRLALSPVLRRAGAVLCITPDLLPIVRTVRPDALLFPAAIDTDQFAPRERPQGRPWTVLLLSRLESAKGSDIAVNGLATFAERHPDVRIVLIDYGVLSPTYQSRYGKRFDFVPKVLPHQAPELIAQADVIVGQFAIGSLGLSELQAMSCAKPVIAAVHDPSAYPSSPPLLNAATSTEVDNYLEDAYQNQPGALELGVRARRWVQDNFASDVLATRLEALYEQVIQKGATGRGEPR